MIDPMFWRDKKVLLTGHTGFKGAWAVTWLTKMGARVTGVGLPSETRPSLFSLADVESNVSSHILDIRDRKKLAKLVCDTRPEIIIHLAAQALVRRSYDEPLYTLETNIIGTANLLDAARDIDCLEAILVVTSDKVYANNERNHPFCEESLLGGHDPYSASKAAAELITASYAKAFFSEGSVKIATARGGNVIGGGDFSADRIVPDIWRAAIAEKPLILRHPHATRPWQHVLDCLGGYFQYVECLAKGTRGNLPRALNFGPDGKANLSVAQLAQAMQKALGADVGWRNEIQPGQTEMNHLSLDTSKSREVLDWQDKLPADLAFDWTAQWYLALKKNVDMSDFTAQQISRYMDLEPWR